MYERKFRIQRKIDTLQLKTEELKRANEKVMVENKNLQYKR